MDLRGALVRDVTRAVVGRVQDVLLDPDSLDARWLRITTDADGGSTLVPAAAVSEFAPGELLLPYPGSQIASAVRVDGAVVSRADAATLLHHYGFDPADHAG